MAAYCVIVTILFVILIISATYTTRQTKRLFRICCKEIARYKSDCSTLNQWLFAEIDGRCLESYFNNRGVKTIAIYGVNELARRLIDKFRYSEKVEIKYLIDKRGKEILAPVPVYKIEELKNDYACGAELVVVALVSIYDEIRESLESATDIPITSLETIINEL